MLPVKESVGGNPSTDAPTLELDEIQATVLRHRPAPYFGTHVLLRVDDARAGRELLRRLTPHVDSAANWWSAADPWLSVAISYAGLEALGVPRPSLESFPEAFRVGMAARARQLGDDGVNDPKNWERPFGTGDVHIGLSAFSDSEEKRRRVLAIAREQYERFSGIRVLASQDFGAQPGDLNPLGYKDGIDQPAIEGSGVEPLPGRGRPIKAGEFILGYPGEAGVPLPMPQPDILGRNGTYVGFRKYQSRVGAFNRFLHANGRTEEERELLAAKLVGRWRSGAPLTLAPDADNPALGADPQRNNDFNYANDRRGLQVPLGSHIRRMNPRDTELARLTDVNVHRLIQARDDVWSPHTIRTRYRKQTMKCRAAPTSCSSAPRRWPPSNSCSKSGSTTAISSAPATSATRSSACSKKARRSRFRRRRSGAASTASKPSTCFVGASTSSCPRCRR